jgi:serine/threonine protein kinase
MSDIYGHALPAGIRIGSYEIQSVLGIGGFGITYRAHDHLLNQIVAIKEYLPNGIACRQQGSHKVQERSSDDREHYQYGLDRFLDEARTLAKFRDPSIVRVLGYIKDNGTAYLIMDFEKGESLVQYLKRQVRLSEKKIYEILQPLLRGLQCIHAQQFLHRDIKPANILLREDGTPLLLDFGSARQALNQQTMLLTAMVTPGYAPFEQYFNDDQQGPWTDLYGVGATIFHCITGSPPTVATKRVALAYENKPDPVSTLLGTVTDGYSSDIINLVDWLLKTNAKDRPQDTKAVLDMLLSIKGVPITKPEKQGQNVVTAIPVEILEGMRLKLAEEIGPIAGTLVKKTSQQTSDLDELTRLLSSFIPTEERRTRFVGKVAKENTNTVMNKMTISSAVNDGSGFSDVNVMDLARKYMAIHIGPIASILIKKTARLAKSKEEFINILAKELHDDKQRNEFLKRMK